MSTNLLLENAEDPVVWRGPVSYTHLDVYKRQVLMIILIFQSCNYVLL